MAYVPKVWQNLPDQSTPIDAASLNHLETQAASAVSDAAAAAKSAFGYASINAKDYGAVGDGLTITDGASIQAAFNACPAGGLVIIPPGDYLLGPTMLVNGTDSNGNPKTMRVQAYGATIYKTTSTARSATFSGGYDAPVAVTAISSGTNTEASQSQNTVTVTHTGTMPWKRGDVVKVYSDDSVPGSRDTNNYTGQFFTVYSVASGSTIFYGVIRDPLVTNIRMARLKPTTFQWEGGQFDMSDAGLAASITGETIGFLNMIGPVVKNVTIRRSPAQAITMGSCYGYEVANTNVLWAWNDAVSRFGYGINDNVSEGGSIHDCRFGQVRHAFTDSNASMTAGQADPTTYGRSYGAHISNCICDGATASGFDTHAGGQNHTFVNCVTYNAPTGFSLRGRQHSMTNCRAVQTNTSLLLFNESDGGESWGHMVSNFVSSYTSGYVLRQYNNAGAGNGTTPQGTRETRPNTVRGLYADNAGGIGVSVLNGSIRMSDIEILYVGSVTATSTAMNQSINSQMFGHDLRFDFFGTTGSGAVLVDAGTTVDSEIEMANVRVTGFSNLASRLAKVFQNTATTNLRIDRLRTDYTIASYADNTTTNSWIDYDVANVRPGGSQGYTSLTQTTAANATTLLNAMRSRLPELVLDCTLTAAATLANLPAPYVQGQQLTVINNSASTAALAISNGATAKTELIAGTAKSLAVGTSITLVGNAAGLWKQTAVVA